MHVQSESQPVENHIHCRDTIEARPTLLGATADSKPLFLAHFAVVRTVIHIHRQATRLAPETTR